MEGAKVQAVGNVDTALDAEEGIEGVGVGMAEGLEYGWLRRFVG